jgi:hypothetical protein
MAADVDNHLYLAIKDMMRSLSRSQEKALFSGEGPLASFGSKIKIGVALRIFGEKTLRDLDTIREIRNGFAHSTEAFDFKTTEVAALCALLYSADLPMETKEPILTSEAERKNPRGRYRIACRVISWHLLFRNSRFMPQEARRRILP